MSGESDRRRAERLVERADHHTVTVDLLTGADEYGSGFYLHDEPAIAVLEPDEQPHAMLFNELKGVGIGSKRDTVTPDGSGATLFLVTDRRLLVLVGQADGDRRFSVPFESITGAEYHTGIMKHRVVVETTEQPYHLWVDASYEEADLQWVVQRLLRASERAGGAGSGASTGGSSATANGTTADGGTGTGGGDAATGTASTAPGSGGGGSTGTGTGTGTGGAGDPSAPSGGADAAGGGRTTSADASGGGNASSAAASGVASGGSDGGSGGDADPLDRLERLQELKEKGVVSEAEFEEKKQELLDQI